MPSTDRRPPRLGDARYALRQLVGDGAVATVWRALDTQSGDEVAIKLMRDETMDLEDIQRLAQEVEILRRLSHPCIVRIYGTGVAEAGNPYVVMEWVDGSDLRRKIERTPILPTTDVVHIVEQICAALTEAHAQGVIHRDVKPENVLLCAPRLLQVKLVDFGMAKVIGQHSAALTFDNKIFGTPQYMAPERARAKPVGAAADVYSVAVIAYELLTGRRPFDGKQPIAVLTQQITDPPPPMGVAPEVERAVLCGLAKDAAERPSAAEFARLLGAAMRATR
jgi:eukaryotic-like serine/threonine-protein kinase